MGRAGEGNRVNADDPKRGREIPRTEDQGKLEKGTKMTKTTNEMIFATHQKSIRQIYMDGRRVELEAQGEEEAIDRFLARLCAMPYADVEHIEARSVPTVRERDFDARPY